MALLSFVAVVIVGGVRSTTSQVESTSAAPAGPQAREAAAISTADVRAVLDQYCVACHNEGMVRGEGEPSSADPLVNHSPKYWTSDRAAFATRRWVEEGETTAVMAAVGIGGRDVLFSVDPRARVAEAARIASRGPDLEVEELTLDAVKVAIELGVDVNIATESGETAVQAARAAGYDTVVEYLVEHGAE